MSYFPSYSQWLAERANSLEGLNGGCTKWRDGGEGRERERESRARVNAQRGRGVCGGMI